MKRLIPIWIILLASCSPKISNYFEANKYIRDVYIHVMNDSLQFHFKSPIDIVYTTDRNELKKILRKQKIKTQGEVLLYGITKTPPYEYVVTVSNTEAEQILDNRISFDTLIKDHTIQFIGKALEKDAQRSLEIDLKGIFNTIEIGEDYRKEGSSIMDVVNRYTNSNKFLAALDELENFPTYDRQEEWNKLQMQLTFSSFLGDNKRYDSYLNQLESRFSPKESISEIIKENLDNQNALETILKEAKNHQVVMINENHFYPNHRFLVMDLLEDFRKMGFEYLALEAMTVGQDSLMNLANAYLNTDTGFYTNEQNFSNLIRKAKELDFTFVAYENWDSNKDREVGQAETIYAKTLEKNPQAKVIVLAGIAHILEKPTPSGKKWMATVFKETYGIDPLTISQTHLSGYRKLSDKEYSIFKSDLFEEEQLNAVDYHVLNNKKSQKWEGSFSSYHNTANSEVQVVLFYGNELEGMYDYHYKVPYFSTLVGKNKKVELPIRNDVDTYLYTLDKYGKRVDHQIIKGNQNK